MAERMKARNKFTLVALAALVAGFLAPLMLSGYYLLPPRAPEVGVPPPSQTGVTEFEVATQLLPPSGTQGLRTFSSIEELKSFVGKLREAIKFRNYISSSSPIFTLQVVTGPRATLPERAGALAAPEKSGGAYSRTNVQVEGIDEPDIAKTNGRLIAVVSGEKVFLVSVQRKSVESALEPSISPRGVYLENDTLVVVCAAPEYRILSPTDARLSQRTVSALLVYDVSDPKHPRRLFNATITGWFTASRMSGRTVYLIAEQPIEELDVPEVDGKPIDPKVVVAVSPRADRYINVLALDAVTGTRSAFSFLTESGGYGWFYMSFDRIYVGYSTVPRMEDLYEQFLYGTAGLVPGEVYEKVASHVEHGNLTAALDAFLEYLSKLSFEEARELVERAAARMKLSWSNTAFHVFKVAGTHLSYAGSFTVPGAVLDQFSMEEHRDYFVVATTRAAWRVKGAVVEGPRVELPARQGEIRVVECGEQGCTEKVIKLNTTGATLPQRRFFFWLWPEAGDPDNCLFTVRLADLRIAGNLSGLAPGERVYSSRLIGDTFYLVTYRNIDPLFAIDVSNPESPSLLGYVKVPGFSEYLHPLPGKLLLGVGWDPDASSLKVSLFDVSDPKSMREISSVKLVGTTSPALYDHHAVLVWLTRSVAMIPVVTSGGGGVAVFGLDGGNVRLRALLEHSGATRSLYSGGEIFTVSPISIRVFDADTLKLLAEVKLES